MNIVITGGSSGLGAAIKALMEELDGVTIHDWSIETDVDITDHNAVVKAAGKIDGMVDVLINCAGVNHLQSIEWLRLTDFQHVMNVNATALFTVTQALLTRLEGGAICNIISNASHMPMTHSLAYNASKGAAHIMTLQMARELWASHAITVFGVSPNKLHSTGMTKYVDKRAAELRHMTAEQAREYQLSKLPKGVETDPAELAEFIAFLLAKKQRHMYLHGCIIPYGA